MVLPGGGGASVVGSSTGADGVGVAVPLGTCLGVRLGVGVRADGVVRGVMRAVADGTGRSTTGVADGLRAGGEEDREEVAAGTCENLGPSPGQPMTVREVPVNAPPIRIAMQAIRSVPERTPTIISNLARRPLWSTNTAVSSGECASLTEQMVVTFVRS